MLFNVAFNGNGEKTGLAVAGIGPADYWNVYTPVNFATTYSYACYSGGAQSFPLTPAVFLLDYAQNKSPVWLERLSPLYNIAGSAVTWDEMLDYWIGGYAGPTPYVNTFNVRGLPPGNYAVYFYANQGSGAQVSTFMVSVNGGAPTSLTNNPTSTQAFLEGENYVVFNVLLPYGGKITVQAIGYWSGLQIVRV